MTEAAASDAPATVSVNYIFGRRFLDVIAEALPEEVVVLADDPRAASADVLAVFTRDPDSTRQSVTPAVRWIHALSTGIDGFPVDVVGDRFFTCSRGASAVAISEWVLAMMLAHAKQLPESWVHEPPPRWNSAQLDTLAGQTAGVIGLGAIGTEVVRRALAFDMTVVGHRRTAAPPPLEGVEMASSLDDLLARSDHIILTVPATAATRHLLDADAFALTKPTAHLVNIARGSLVDQDAMLAALDDGRLGAASLDVVEPEPLPEGHPLYTHPRVRLSPHISWSTPYGIASTLELFVENVRRYRAGEPLAGTVDLAAGY